ncbi:hypothetical protein [Roseibium alexandrii]|uniref:Uncharacterized protein n=1 Tax=Roseibium alexandrii (strain DSM 17067 / NCIMB 14079 / DFL-11) TaxID=244592 RepID=A0A5E8UXB8_ROSAD|nr:hypothetical protein [Roseibium alexandrii]RMX61874.1 hypothetical protein SADFL11_00046190 [Roseibium alexandrii DFL-11]
MGERGYLNNLKHRRDNGGNKLKTGQSGPIISIKTVCIFPDYKADSPQVHCYWLDKLILKLRYSLVDFSKGAFNHSCIFRCEYLRCLNLFYKSQDCLYYHPSFSNNVMEIGINILWDTCTFPRQEFQMASRYGRSVGPYLLIHFLYARSIAAEASNSRLGMTYCLYCTQNSLFSLAMSHLADSNSRASKCDYASDQGLPSVGIAPKASTVWFPANGFADIRDAAGVDHNCDQKQGAANNSGAYPVAPVSVAHNSVGPFASCNRAGFGRQSKPFWLKEAA